MPVRVGINGFGRIGRNVFRAAMARGDIDQIEWVAVNDLTDCRTLAHLLKYDSILGPYPGEVTVADEQTIVIDGRELRVLAERDPAGLLEGAQVPHFIGIAPARLLCRQHEGAGANRCYAGAALGRPTYGP